MASSIIPTFPHQHQHHQHPNHHLPQLWVLNFNSNNNNHRDRYLHIFTESWVSLGGRLWFFECTIGRPIGSLSYIWLDFLLALPWWTPPLGSCPAGG
jgi:hypothetical protein